MSLPKNSKNCSRIPKWLRVKLPCSQEFSSTKSVLQEMRLETVCQQAKCPNAFECFSKKIATFLIMGPVCSRNCAFCNITGGRPNPLDQEEPTRVAEASAKLGLKHVVVTSVTRDDLPDGGASHFASTITAIQKALPNASIEVLIPDFQGNKKALEIVLDAGPDIVNHNLETVPRLYGSIRPEADYAQSLKLIRRVKELSSIEAKSGLMVGLGETVDEIKTVIHDLHQAGADMVTIGQYMRPSKKHPPVQYYMPPEEFDFLADFGHKLGIPKMFCAPLVRSSYHAGEFV